jgi:hypothetical protein
LCDYFSNFKGIGEEGNKKGKPERSAGLVVVLFFGVVGWVRGYDRVYF